MFKFDVNCAHVAVVRQSQRFCHLPSFSRAATFTVGRQIGTATKRQNVRPLFTCR